MNLARNVSSAKVLRDGRRVALTIGAFDGIHLGHQALLAAVRRAAAAQNLLSVVMSFEPTPKEFFALHDAPARLTNFRERFHLLRQADIDLFFCPRFDRAMAGISVDRFIEELLVRGLGVSHLIIGDDFRFGHRAAGTVDDLQRASRAADFAVERIDSVIAADDRVSSTRIRRLLADGSLADAAQLLGRPFALSGRVIHGQKLGRTLGYPTANIALQRKKSPVTGIFAVRVEGIDRSTYDGVASIGTRPTVDGEGVLLEVFVFDFSGDLYGRRLSVTLVAKLRDEVRFDGLDALTAQMDRDAEDARRILSTGTLSA
ncbi:MAG: bifunctional riboflavin kinase/FAD synthetase [Pseudomonadota bacterium]